MLFFLLFIFELILLFFLSRRLINSLAQIIYRFTKSHRAVVNILAIIFLPGTIFHELAHLLIAGVMLVQVGEINVLPEVLSKGQPSSGWEETGVKLGSVQIGHTDPFRRMIIGLAPVLFGILSILAALYFVRSENHFVFWQVFLVLYLVFEIGNTMFSSKRDLEGAIGFLAIMTVAAIVVVILYFLNPVLIQQIWLWLNNLNLEGASNFFKMASIYLVVPILLDVLVILLTKSLIGRRYVV